MSQLRDQITAEQIAALETEIEACETKLIALKAALAALQERRNGKAV